MASRRSNTEALLIDGEKRSLERVGMKTGIDMWDASVMYTDDP
jgi:hypothetical protein